MVAFLRQGELTQQLWDELRAFSDRGGRIDWIVGTDLGGTDGRSLRHLLDLKNKYPANRIRVMKLSGSAVFHPKFYWLSDARTHFAIVGSANCTGGGLGNNLELSVKIRATRGEKSFPAVEELLSQLWDDVDRTRHPLTPGDLLPLDSSIVERLSEYHTATERSSRGRPRHPYGRPAARLRAGRRRTRVPGSSLAMELTMEQGKGRETQVQPPQAIWERYFGVDLDRPGVLLIREETPGSRYRARPIVRHHHNWTIELSGADVPRPALVRFRRTGPRSYVYRVLRPRDRGYRGLDRLLRTAYNPWRGAARGRRWLVY